VSLPTTLIKIQVSAFLLAIFSISVSFNRKSKTFSHAALFCIGSSTTIIFVSPIPFSAALKNAS
jgi:hypothetical protein